MGGFNFKSRKTAEKLKKLAGEVGKPPRKPPKNGTADQDDNNKGGLILKTPSGGIPARSGDTCGKADCELYYIDADDDLTERTQPDGSSFEIECYNLSTEAVASETYIQAKWVGTKLVADVEYCDQS